MPKKLELSLKRGAKKHRFKTGGKRYDAYVYGYLAKRKKRLKLKRKHT
jgi:hypothetical protein